jgi:hypothetical protein
MKMRMGHTLIEMAAVLVLLSTLTGIVGALLRRSVVGYSQTVDGAFEMRLTDVWMERLRLEINEASEVNVDADGSVLALKVADRETIQYGHDESGTTRQRTVNDRTLAMERIQWTAPRFVKKDSDTCSIIDVDVAQGLSLRARVGISRPNATEPMELQK